ncbi:MAG: hypothetical protein ABR511_09540 [Acidimicrobiales bacterium]
MAPAAIVPAGRAPGPASSGGMTAPRSAIAPTNGVARPGGRSVGIPTARRRADPARAALSARAALTARTARPTRRASADLPVMGPVRVAASAGAVQRLETGTSTAAVPTDIAAALGTIGTASAAGTGDAASQAVPVAVGPGGQPATGASPTPTGTGGAATTTGAASGGATNAATPTTAASPTTSEVLDRFDEMVDRLEERVLAEIERRGGRFAGMF